MTNYFGFCDDDGDTEATLQSYPWLASMPHGSGIDSDIYLDIKDDKVVVMANWHHMDEYGMYAGWADFTIVINPEDKTIISVKVEDRNLYDEYGNVEWLLESLEEYLGDLFAGWLSEMRET